MTQEDYKVIAQALNSCLCWMDACLAVADALGKRDGKFDRDAFLRDCGVIP